MSPIQGLGLGSSLFITRGALSLRRSPGNFSTIAPTSQLRLGQFADSLQRIRELLEGLKTKASAELDAESGSPARAISSSALDFESIATPTTLRSIEEVNTTPTSFSPFGPTISGSSTSEPTLGGVYDGDQGDDLLRFEFRDNATVGTSDKLRVRVRDGGGNVVDDLDFKNVPAGTSLTLSNGLTLALGPGDVSKNDFFEVAVATSVGSAVDPDLPFDGTRNQNPNLEPGQAIGAGSFEVNGVSFSVNADDSINAVLARITASAAGVSASFDSATESVVLTQQTAGSVPSITLANDTSGFVQATKLDTALAVPGQDGGDGSQEPLANLPAFASVTDGAFSVNGVSISVDVDVDSLQDIVDRVNQLVPTVRATLDGSSDQLSFESQDPSEDLLLADAGSGFLSAVKISPGIYQGNEATAASQNDLKSIRNDLVGLRGAVKALFTGGFAGLSVELTGARNQSFQTAITRTFSSVLGRTARGGAFRSGLGIDFDFSNPRGDILELDLGRLQRVSRSDPSALQRFLYQEAAGEGDDPGLVPQLLNAINQLEDDVTARLDPDLRGLRIDLSI